MTGFLVDIRSSLRNLARTPAYAISVVLALVLGIGTNTAFFSIINTVVLNPFPYRDPDRLVMVWESNPALGALTGPRAAVSWQTFDDWRRQNESFECMAAFQVFKTILGGLEKPEELSAAYASSDFFPLLGIQTQLGRVFSPEDMVAGTSQVAVVSAGFASRHFSKGENPVGHSLILDGKPSVIVGVLPASFHLLALYAGINEPKPDIWVPLQAMTAHDPATARQQRRLFVAARIKTGVALDRARGEMVELTRRLAQQDSTLEGFGVNVFPFTVENIELDFKTALYLQWAALALILLMACANVANLTLVRWNARQKEIAVMLALGASRKRLLSRMVMESGLLACAGWLLGLSAAYLGIRVVVAIRPSEIYEIDRIAIDLRAAGYAVLLTALVTVLVGLVPSLLATRRLDLVTALKASGSAKLSRRSTFIPRQLLISMEIAVALALAVSATLLTRSFQNVLAADAGFHTAGVETAHVSLPKQTYATEQERLAFFRKLAVALQSEPGVQMAGFIDYMPLVALNQTSLEVDGRPAPRPSDAPMADFANATPEFFEALSIRVKTGRLFTKDEKNVVVINQALARRLWADQDPLGQHIRRISPEGPWCTVIGVVADFRQFNMETPARPEIIWPAEQAPRMTIVLRATKGTEAGSLGIAVRRAVWSIDKNQPVADVETLDEIVKRSLSQRRFDMLLVNIFAALGVGLAAIGIYGVISYQAASRTRETGVRYALGATRGQVFRSLLFPSLPVGVAGIAVGAGCSLLLTRALGGLLFGVKSFDALTYSTMAAAVLIIVIASSGLAAWKGARVDPLTLLRYE